MLPGTRTDRRHSPCSKGGPNDNNDNTDLEIDVVLSCPHCTGNAPYMRCDFYGQWIVCRKCETPFRWQEVGAGRDAGRTVGTAAGALDKEIER